MIRESDLAVKWKVIEAMDMMDDYLNLMPDTHLKIEVNGKCEVAGSYQFGAQDGSIDGQFEHEQDRESLRLIFTFEGSDEGDGVHGFGTASFESEDTLLLKMHYHMGDTYSFRCIRM